jgi:hypothetical protein
MPTTVIDFLLSASNHHQHEIWSTHKLCHMSPIFAPRSFSWSNIENSYCMGTFSVVVKYFAEKHYVIGTGHLGNYCGCVYNTEWTQERVLIRMCCCLLIFAMSDISTFYLKYRIWVDHSLDKSTNYWNPKINSLKIKQILDTLKEWRNL